MSRRTSHLGFTCAAVFAFTSITNARAIASDERVESDSDRKATVVYRYVESDEADRVHWIGVACSDSIPDVLRAHVELPAGEGLVVLRVVPDSPAHNAGLAEHDILLKANGESLRSVSDLVQTVSESGEKPIQLEWVHEGDVAKAEIQPAKRPQRRPIAEPRRPFQMRFFGPAFQVPENLDKEFPDDLKIEITKEGGQPLHIAVRKGDRTWELNEDELGELPKDLRAFVDQLVGKSFTLGFPKLEELEKQFDFNIDIPAPENLKLELKRRIPAPPLEIEERLEQLNERLDGLYDELRKLRGSKDSTEEDEE